MKTYEFNIIREHRLRYALTSLGIALCALLMLFLVAIYQGISYGSVEYVRASDADLWVLQEHATNILRSTSILPVVYQEEIKKLQGVKSVSPVFFILASVKINGNDASLYLTGYDPKTGAGGPPHIVEGRNPGSVNEIVIDKAFAAKNKVGIGSRIYIRNDSLEICGISTGTNMFVIQYGFIYIDKAYEIIGLKDVASCFQVQVLQGYDHSQVKAEIDSLFTNIVVYDKNTFTDNNIREMESGIIPMLFIVTLISAVVLTSILSLILSVSVLEKRKDYAIMKALGSPRGFIAGLIVRLSIILSLIGLSFTMVLYFPLLNLVERISPEVSAKTSVMQIITVFAGVIIISLVSSFLPNQRIRKIYPIEVFM